MDQFGWDTDHVVTYFGAILTCVGIMSFICFMFIGPLAMRMDERALLIVLGLISAVFGRALFFPFPGSDPPHKSENASVSSILRYGLPIRDNVECPKSNGQSCTYDWCDTQPAIKLSQFIVGTMILSAGHPFRIALTQAIFSKILGPIPQVRPSNVAGSTVCIIIQFLCREHGLDSFPLQEVQQD